MISWLHNSITLAKQAAAGLADLVLPAVCPGCEADVPSGHGLCEACLLKLLDNVSRKYCPRCGASLPPAAKATYDDGCFDCPTPLPRFRRVFRLGSYAAPLRHCIGGLKYRRHTATAGQLTAMLAEHILATTADDYDFDLIVPVPMFWRRQMTRGLNHATYLAERLARKLDIPLEPALIRHRDTPPQVHRSRTKRIENVRDAFRVRNSKQIAGLSILLVDDVTTTGATAGEAARCLLNGGANRVSLAVLAKSDRRGNFSE